MKQKIEYVITKFTPLTEQLIQYEEDRKVFNAFSKEFQQWRYLFESCLKEGSLSSKAMFTNGHRSESLDEAIHGKEEIMGFLKMAKQVGIKTIDELAKFLKDNKRPEDRDEYETMLRYRASLGNDFKIDPTVNEDQKICNCSKFKKDDFRYDDDYTSPMMECDNTVDYDDDYRINYGE